MERFKTQVIDNQEILPRHYRLVLSASPRIRAARAGQFVHVLARSNDVFDPLLRRAFSITKVESDSFDIIYRAEGRGTTALSSIKPGTKLDLVGPLGMPFSIEQKTIWVVGGGVGVPPLALLAQQTNSAKDGRYSLKAFIGAKTSVELLCLPDFQEYGVDTHTATEDGSHGHQGYITQVLETHLVAHLSSQASKPLICAPLICACGPLPMLSAVAAICARHDVPCQVSMEENMPCGIGVCNGCVIAAADASDDYGKFRRVCVEGPVMWSQSIDW